MTTLTSDSWPVSSSLPTSQTGNQSQSLELGAIIILTGSFLLSTYYAPGTMASPLVAFFYGPSTPALRGRHLLSAFPDKELEAQGG